MKCALIQLNPKVGDISGNLDRMTLALSRAAGRGAELCLFPEMAITGYPPRDLLLYPAFIREAEEAGERLSKVAGELGVAVVAGSVGRNHDRKGHSLYNKALVLEGGKIIHSYAKRLLPTYDVFDEARYFEAGNRPLVIQKGGYGFAVTICEDIWNDEAFWPHPLYKTDPLEDDHPPFDVLINLSASPFSVGKQRLREKMLKALSLKYGAITLYVNQTGANDELIFDGRSSYFLRDGTLAGRALPFKEDLLIVDLKNPKRELKDDDFSPESETWRALSLGVKDYLFKNNLKTAVIGLSGGVDSALTAAIAADYLGKENVEGLVMPSPYSSDHSVKDAEDLARNLGLTLISKLPIESAMESIREILSPVFKDLPLDSAEENIQARIRGVLLMAVSNKFGRALLTTGNKSEISVGYCTIYGDMCGALAVIGDLYKTEVFRLARWLNRDGTIIPINTLNKPPSAELRPDQTDQDSLPPYELLDSILVELLEARKSPEELISSGEFDPKIVERVGSLVKSAEFKRRQAAPVLKITGQAFGVGWRMPVSCESIFKRGRKGA
jgi:NAD+ synthetase